MEREKKKRILPLIRNMGGVILGMTLLSSCFQQASSGKRTNSDFVVNSPSSVSTGYGRVLEDNPIILSGNASLSPEYNLGLLLRSGQEYISESQFLEGSCLNLEDCFRAREASNVALIQATDNKWAFQTTTSSFLQVQTFAHIKRILNKFHSNISTHFSLVNGGLKYKSAVPDLLMVSKSYWKNDKTLEGYALCDLEDNASFSAANYELCMGYDSIYENLKFSQDNTVIYHEVGHAMVDIMMNMRNNNQNYLDSTFVERSDLGYLSYDEAGAINEGLADYFSYFMNQRTHFGEWALGRVSFQSRPMSESDPIHAAGISTASNERLSYPTYLNYDPNQKSKILEDIHYAGQIMSHFLVAFTQDVQDRCKLTNEKAIEYTLFNITESLAELGDLTTKASDHYSASNNINLNKTYASLFVSALRPIDYRSFSQTFAKNVMRTFGNSATGMCAVAYQQDYIESLLDQYGLLLFRNYNDSLNGDGGTGLSDRIVIAGNRKKSELISKSVLKLEDRTGKVQAIVVDSQESMKAVRTALVGSGQIAPLSSRIDSDLGYNNANGKISPGEFVGLLVNLRNTSNSTVSGVRLIGSDWAHFYKDTTTATPTAKPCNIDSYPNAGAVGTDTNANSSCADLTIDELTDGTAANTEYLTYKHFPSCMVQINDANGTRMASQKELMEKISLTQNKCLDPNDPKSCFIRIPRGGDYAWYSRIEAGATWIERFVDSSTGKPKIKTGNLIYLEVSPDIPAGTVFSCRFRASFTNCSDCFDNGTNTDFKDSHYMEDDPYKIIKFEFTVTD
ncbi:putative lipoprotein [Bacteriovorax sp. BSW11_IV]|uniref:lipoprotein n=1 Tax=Bacteriovorax sp. BSW11_IV TaxID=1353529 RepID=UPI00038A42B1|nr:lipoprotein [Bacteriovorax sp. BSW11_IV]EQC50253.1 putative lipoprotein [Bacteriovorax sp. BSW11_IV]